MCARLAILSWLNLKSQRLPDRRAAGARWKGLDMDEDIFAATNWFDESEASLIVPRFELSDESH